MLYIVYKTRLLENQNKDSASLIEDMKSKVEEMLKEWIVLGDVIGGSFFGFSVKYSGPMQTELKMEDQELKVDETL